MGALERYLIEAKKNITKAKSIASKRKEFMIEEDCVLIRNDIESLIENIEDHRRDNG